MDNIINYFIATFCVGLALAILIIIFPTDDKNPKIYKKGSAVILEDSSRIHFPDSVIAGDGYHTVWHDGSGYKIESEIIISSSE